MFLNPKLVFLEFFCMFMLVGAITNYGQIRPYESKHYSFRDGLPGRLVLDVTQDKTGLIWLATEKGLARFDGYEFIEFNNFNYSFDIAGTDFQFDIRETPNKEFAIFHGQLDLTYELFDLKILKNWQPNLSEFTGSPLAIFTKNDGKTYFVLEKKETIGIYELTQNRNFQELFTISHTPNDIEKMSLFVDEKDIFWLNYSRQEIHLYAKDGKLKKQFTKADFEPEVNSLEWMFIHQDQQERLWLALKKEKGVYLYDSDTQTFKKFSLYGRCEYFSDVWEDKKGNLLFKGARHRANAYVDDLICLRPNDNQTSFAHLKHSVKAITTIYAKNFFEQVIIGAPNGLTIINQKPTPFQQLLAKKLKPGDWGRSIRGIIGDGKGNVFIGTETNQLFQYNFLKDSLFQLPLNNKYAIEDRVYFGGRTIFLDKDRQIWSLSDDSEKETFFHRYNIKSQLTKTLKVNGLTNNYIFDGNRFFYLVMYNKKGEEGRLMVYDLKKNTFSKWLDSEGNNPILGTRSRSITSIQDGIFWIGMTKGLLKIDLKNKKSALISLKKENGQLFDSQEVIAISRTKENLWLGTSNGFVLWDKTTKVIKESYEEKDGLVNNSVCGIMPDSEGNLWLSTFDGLSFFDRKQYRFYNFYESDGLSHYEFNRMAFHQDNRGQYYFGGMNGINVFNAEQLLKSKGNNPLVLTKYVKSYADIDSQTVQIANLDNLKKISLPPNNSHFEFHFAMPNFLSNEIRYSAWLENYEKEWNFLGNNPKVRYNKLPAGNYTLHIKAVDAKGNPAQNQLKIPIFVQEIFYKQAWFQLSMMTLSLLLVWGIAQYHAAQRLKVERLRTKLSSDLHDEVSGLLAGIAMQTDLMQLSIEDEKHKDKLNKIGTTSRSAMSKMGDVIWSVDARKDKFEDLLLRMQEHTAEILQPLGIDYQFEVGKFNVQKKLGLKLRQNLYLIFKESINNIAKHSNASKVIISIQNEGNLFHLNIKDNGQAKPKNTVKKTGQGLANLKMRTAEIQGKLAIYNKNGYEVQLKVRKFA